MASTTFHIPDEILHEIDRAARGKGMSRNRFVLQACNEALARQAGEWPSGFFESAYSVEEERLLSEAAWDLERGVLARRGSRGTESR